MYFKELTLETKWYYCTMSKRNWALMPSNQRCGIHFPKPGMSGSLWNLSRFQIYAGRPCDSQAFTHFILHPSLTFHFCCQGLDLCLSWLQRSQHTLSFHFRPLHFSAVVADGRMRMVSIYHCFFLENLPRLEAKALTDMAPDHHGLVLMSTWDSVGDKSSTYKKHSVS